jgi:hypothetical protein
MNLLWSVLTFAALFAFGWAGGPWLRRHPLAGCVIFAFGAAVFTVVAVADAVLGSWGYMAADAAVVALCAYGFWKSRARRKQAQASPT